MALAREHLAALAALQAAEACDRADGELPRLALAALTRLVPADGQIVWLRDAQDQDSARTVTRDADGEHAFEGLVAADPLLTATLLDGARSFAPDAPELRASRLAPSEACVAAAPIELGQARLGALAAVHADGAPFAASELDLLALGASTLARTLVAIAGREERARSIACETMLVSTLARSAMAESVQVALEQVAEGARRIVAAPLAAILLAEPGGSRLSGVSGDASRVLLDGGRSALAPLLDAFEPGPLSSGEPFLHASLPGLLADLAPRRPGIRARAQALGLGAALVCPLVAPDGVVGVLLLALPDAPLDPPSIPSLADLAAHAGRLLARSGDGAPRSPRREAACALAATLAARDRRAGADAQVVSELARTLARALGLDDERCEEAALAGLLYDIGRLALPGGVPGEPGERARQEEQPAIAARILRGVPGLETIADAVRASHEHLDGTGYPDGLAGAEIPRVARIVAVCESWHAMTSDRPQRPRLERSDALARLRAMAGTALDPELVAALCEALGAHAGHALRHAS